MRRAQLHLRCALVAVLALGGGGRAWAIDSARIVASALSPDCLAYRVIGMCFWLACSGFSCEVRTSVKVSHYVPDAVVSSYSDTGRNSVAQPKSFGELIPTELPACNVSDAVRDGSARELGSIEIEARLQDAIGQQVVQTGVGAE